MDVRQFCVVSGTITVVWFPNPLEDSGPKGPYPMTERLPLTLERVDKGLDRHVLLEFGIDVMGREDLRGAQRETSWGLSFLFVCFVL